MWPNHHVGWKIPIIGIDISQKSAVIFFGILVGEFKDGKRGLTD